PACPPRPRCRSGSSRDRRRAPACLTTRLHEHVFGTDPTGQPPPVTISACGVSQLLARGDDPPGTPRWPVGPSDSVARAAAPLARGDDPPGTTRWPVGPSDSVARAAAPLAREGGQRALMASARYPSFSMTASDTE